MIPIFVGARACHGSISLTEKESDDRGLDRDR